MDKVSVILRPEVEAKIRGLVGVKLSQTDFEWLVDRVLCIGLEAIPAVLEEDEELTLAELLRDGVGWVTQTPFSYAAPLSELSIYPRRP